MNIEGLTEGAIIVELTPDDMRELNITYEEMDYSNIETRRVIWTILARARKSLGEDIDATGTMTVEALPQKAGGCLLFFSTKARDSTVIRPGRRFLMKRSSHQAVYTFATLENVYRAAARLVHEESTVLESELYAKGSFYRLILTCCDTASVRDILCEYARSGAENDLLCAHTREQWRCLVKENALKLLLAEH